METLFKSINHTSPISKIAVEELKNIIEIVEYPAHHKIVEIGDKANNLYFLLTGIARAYTISNNGTEYNSSLFFEKYYISSFDAMLHNKKSKVAIECLTDCSIVKCNYTQFIKLADKYVDINFLYIKSIENFIILAEERDIQFATLSGTERYLSLKKKVYNIDNLISQKNIASHIGVTPVQLSRLKKKLYSS